MTNTIEKIEDIDITTEMVEKARKEYNPNLSIYYCIKAAIQASTQIQELIAENKRFKSEILKLVAELIILKDENEWQPIESLPDDLSDFDLWADGKRFTDCTRCNNKFGLYECENSFGYVFKEINKATHWRPLPQPPKEQNND